MNTPRSGETVNEYERVKEHDTIRQVHTEEIGKQYAWLYRRFAGYQEDE